MDGQSSHVSPPTFSLSSQQRGIWLHQLMFPESALYNISSYLKIDGPLDIPLLERALKQIIQGHDALRLMFSPGEPLPRQWFCDARDWSLEQVDFSERSDPDTRALLWMKAQMGRPMPLVGQLLFQFSLVTVSPDRHYLFQKYHHIIFDGWSGALAIQHMAKAYNALLTGQPLTESLGSSYLDVITADQAYANSEAYTRDEAFWKEKFTQRPEPLPRYAPAQPSVPEGNHLAELWLDSAVFTRLQTFAKGQGTTPFQIVLGALYCYFTRTGQREDFAVGMPTLNRPDRKQRRTVGLCANIAVAWYRFGTELTFTELLRALKDDSTRDTPHRRYPFDDLNRLVGLAQTHRSRLFDVNLSYTSADYDVALGEATARFSAMRGDNPYGLSIYIDNIEASNQLAFQFKASPSLFTREELERMVLRLERLLGEVMDRPDVPLHALCLMPDTERAQVLQEFNPPPSLPEMPGCVHELFAAQAARTPHAFALCFDDGEYPRTLTYRELDTRANQLAWALRARGVGPERVVAVLLERSPELIVALLAVHKAGGAYLPLVPATPRARLDFMLQDAEPHLILTHSTLASRFALSPERCLRVDADAADLALQSTTAPDSGVCAENLAYIIYTSGSTGVPKGVLVNHAALSNVAHTQTRVFELTSRDRVLHAAAISFDAAIGDMWMALHLGATLCMGSIDATAPGEPLLSFLVRQRITAADLTPSALAALPEHPLPELRLLTVGGEACPAELVRRWAPGRRFVNIYGPTEATINSTFLVCEPGPRAPGIGRPLPGTQVYVLDRHQQPLPRGAAGELYLGGVGVARGYLRRPALTPDRFLPNPFGPGRLYRTGDLARWGEDGQLEFLGRVDRQVKLRGLRIELGEIEQALREQPGVRDAAVLLRPDTRGEPGLVAYLVAGADAVSDAGVVAMRQALGARLPEYMVPTAWVTLDALPLTPHGKVDHAALPSPTPRAAVRNESFVAPRTPTEASLARVWCEVLGLSQVGAHDNYFALGGNSLLAVRLFSRIRQCFGSQLSLGGLFQHPTLEAMARLLGDAAPAEDLWAPLVSLQPHGSQPPFFCIPGVTGHVFYLHALARHLGPQRPVYGLQAVGLDGHTPPDTSLHAMAERYLAEVLRVRPHGPYHLGGHSLGGQVAFMLAQHLVARGEQVTLALLDSDIHPDEQPIPQRFTQAEVIDVMLHALEVEFPVELSAERARLTQLQSEQERLLLLRECEERLKLTPPDTELALVKGRVQVVQEGLQMRDAPKGALRAPVRLFCAKDEGEEAVRYKVQGWSPLCSLTTELSPGGHFSLLSEPHASTLGRQIAAWLDAADGQSVL